MDCDIRALTKEELDLLLESIPRKAYLRFGDPKKVMVAGFHDINKIPDKMFFNNIRRLIDKETLFANQLSKFLKMERDNYFKEIAKYEQDGYDHTAAYAKVLEKNISDEYRAVYLKVFGESEDDAKAILRTIESEAALESKIKAIVTPLIPGPDKRIDSLVDEVAYLKAEVAKAAKTQKETKESFSSSQTQLRKELLEELKERISKIESSISSLSTSLRKSIADVKKKSSGIIKMQPSVPTKEIAAITDSLESLSKRVNDLEEAFVDLPEGAANKNQSNVETLNPFEIISVPEVLDVDVSDEDYIEDNIIDVAENRIPHGSADLYREAILECIYSDKPIAAAGNSAKHLVEELSGVLTGQMYSRIKLVERNFTYADLVAAIKKTCPQEEPSVVLIEGVLGKGELTTLFRRLKGVAPKAKFVFALPETRFVKFLDPSTFNECLYFGGKFKDVPASYAYQTSISEHPETDNPECETVRDSLGIRNAFGFKLHQNGWRGIVAYCYLPYLTDYAQMSLNDALAKIQDPDLRRKCKEVFDA